MKRVSAALILFGALSAFAQTTLTPQISLRRVEEPTLETFTFGAGSCGASINVLWSNTTTIAFVTQCSSSPVLKVWSSTSECGNAPLTGDVRYTDIPGATLQTIKQGQFTVKLSELPGFDGSLTTDGGVVACGADGITRTHRLCGAIEYTVFTGVSCGTATTTTASPLKVVYDTAPPIAPTITEYAAQDEGVKVTFTVDSDTAVVILEVRAQGEADYRQIQETSTASAATIIGKGLVNNTTYDVRLRARDSAGNTSEPSSSVAVTPIKTLGFYGFYRQAGGTDGGCSSAPGLLFLLGAALLFWRRRNGSI